MADDKCTSQVPSSELIAISTKLTEVASGVKSIKDDLLPPVARDARDAREGVIKLTGWNRDIVRRIDMLEATESIQDDRLDAATSSVVAHGRDIHGLSKWRWWLMGLAITFGLALFGAAGKALWATATAQAERTGTRRDVDRHEVSIEELKAIHAEDRRVLENVVRAVKAVPGQIKQAVQPPSIEDAVDDEPLTDWERWWVQRIIKRARERNGTGNVSE